MNPQQLHRALRAAGFILIRQRRHRIYQHQPSGKILCIAATPSDSYRWAKNVMQTVRKILRVDKNSA